MITIIVPMAATEMGQALQPLAWRVKKLGGDSGVYSATEEYYLVKPEHGGMLTQEVIDAVLGAGGDILNFPVFFEVADKTAEVPVGVPDRSYVNEEGETVIRTWDEWDTDGSITINGTEYVNSSGFRRTNPPLSEITADYILNVPENNGEK
jgi:hypothetical protein